MEWMVTLCNDDAPELGHFDHFMTAENHLADRKARKRIKTISQHRQPVTAYTQEFCDLACRLTDWLNDMLIECFQDGLNNNVYKHASLEASCTSSMAGISWLKKSRLTWLAHETNPVMDGGDSSWKRRKPQNHWPVSNAHANVPLATSSVERKGTEPLTAKLCIQPKRQPRGWPRSQQSWRQKPER